jgi:hypothetical protein
LGRKRFGLIHAETIEAEQSITDRSNRGTAESRKAAKLISLPCDRGIADFVAMPIFESQRKFQFVKLRL